MDSKKVTSLFKGSDSLAVFQKCTANSELKSLFLSIRNQVYLNRNRYPIKVNRFRKY
jgi:hypothetical protein